MSSIFRLPEDLSRLAEPEALNRELREGAVRLDWSAVKRAESGELSRLLAGLDLAAHAEALGLDTVPDALSDAVSAALEASGSAPDAGAPASIAAGDAPRPAVWEPPDAEADESEEEDPEDDAPESVPPRVLRNLSAVQIRDELERRVLLELLGPASGPEEEVAEQTVRDRYLVGSLAPRNRELPAEEQDQLAEAGGDDDEDGMPDEPAAGRPALLPSSIGMTFCVDGSATALTVRVGWGRYARTDSATLTNPETGDPVRVWKRSPVNAVLETLPLAEGRLEDWIPDPETPDVSVQGVGRRIGDDWVVTLFLVNNQAAPEKGEDTAWLFQVELEVRSVDGSAGFVRRALDSRIAAGAAAPPVDERIMDMLYRDRVEFAVGHGTGVHVEVSQESPLRAHAVRTAAVPRFEVPQTTPPIPGEKGSPSADGLDMKTLAETPVERLAERLQPLVEAYGAWIKEQEDAARDGKDGLGAFREEAEAALEQCRQAGKRIREGIAMLAADPQAAEAFRFMNIAMWRQRVRSKYAEAVRRGTKATPEEFDLPENRTWYPFQLAFVLLTLAGVTDLHHPERSGESTAVVDLLWFPTGGGKTEAYLGVAAYVMALRRLRGPVAGRDGEHGVAVVMRYTLRLLTIQQFQRATALACACESIRREALRAGDRRWGESPFRIGLWVGKRVTPNTTEQSDEAVKKDHGDGFKKGGSIAAGSGSPHQLVNCPWCGTEIRKGSDIHVEKYSVGRGRTILYCGDRLGRCLFSRAQARGEGLPVLVVDEEIYRDPPQLLIATADKFAQMPWKGEVQTLFGQVTGRCERHGFRSPDLEDADSHPRTRDGSYPPARTHSCLPLRPPDLIIQDELHLISGPLGTLVGLYETAVDRLASWEVEGRLVRPKIIASTATIRRAPQQVHALYQRRVQVFPPRGLTVIDNFFSRQRTPSETYPGRLYLGICARGRRTKAALIRTSVALMAAAQALYEECGAAADPWMTLVGYFNSMKELGGMRRLVDDDIASRLRRMDERGLARRFVNPMSVEELTSRKASTDIPAILDRLEVTFDPSLPRLKAEAAKKLKAGERRRYPFDAVLATNMVSVGVDVQRLGLMLVCGQPKTTAEYIQATSRVGRRHPGLVVIVYNWARPRDLSHYESFEHYHATFYKHVEALSVTPFAARALDRGLFAVLASLVRLGGIEFNANDRAAHVTAHAALVQEAVEWIRRRAHAVGDEKTAGEVRSFLAARLDHWAGEVSMATGARPLGFRDTAANKGLLKPPGKEPWGDFTCPNSLRDVEPTVQLIMRDEGMDERSAFTARADHQPGEEEA